MFKLDITGECSALNRAAILHSPKGSGTISEDRAEQFKGWKMEKSVKRGCPFPRNDIATETVNTQQLSIPA